MYDGAWWSSASQGPPNTCTHLTYSRTAVSYSKRKKTHSPLLPFSDLHSLHVLGPSRITITSPLLLFDRHWPPATLNLNLTHTPRLSVFPLQAMLAMLFPLQAMLVSLFPRVDFSWLLFPSVSLQAMLAWGAAHGYRWQVQDAGDMAGPLKGITPLHLAALLEVSHLQSVLS